MTDENGDAIFENVYPGEYSVNETLQDGWTQSSVFCEYAEEEWELSRQNEWDQEWDSSYLDVQAGQTRHCYIGNYREPTVEIQKTNNTTGPITPGTTVTFTLTITVPGPLTSGQLQGATNGSDYLPVTVTDNLTNEFDYVPGSFTATSNVRGDLVASGITTDPNYASRALGF